MEIFSLLKLLIGGLLLIKGADLVVEHASVISRKLGVSEVVIGLTIVSFGTSAPELVFNSLAVFQRNFDLAVGNIIGSNLANVLLVLGLSACVARIPISQKIIREDLPMNFLVGMFMIVLLWVSWIPPKANSMHTLMISRGEGLLLLSLFMAYLWWTFQHKPPSLPQADQPHVTQELPSSKKENIGTSVLFMCLGLAGLFLGGKWLIDGSLYICKLFGISEGVVGLTIVAIGTSFPEIATSVIAAKKGKMALLLGNIFGSNICNLLLVLGVSSLIRSIPISPVFVTEFLMNIGLYILIALFYLRGHMLTRNKGILLLMGYGGYLTYLLLRM